MPKVRTATYDDISNILDFIRNYHETKSNLKDIPFDKRSMVSTIDYHIGSRAAIALIYETEESGIQGVLLGGVEVFPHNHKELWASDTLLIAEGGGAYLAKRFHKWARMKGVKRIFMGVSTSDPRADALYQSLGMEQTGGMYVLR